MVPVSVDRGVSWLPATMTTGVSGRQGRGREAGEEEVAWVGQDGVGTEGRVDWGEGAALRGTRRRALAENADDGRIRTAGAEPVQLVAASKTGRRRGAGTSALFESE